MKDVFSFMHINKKLCTQMIFASEFPIHMVGQRKKNGTKYRI